MKVCDHYLPQFSLRLMVYSAVIFGIECTRQGLPGRQSVRHYFSVGAFLIFLGCILAGYGATYGGSNKHQTRQYVSETLIIIGLIFSAVLSVAQGAYLVLSSSSLWSSSPLPNKPTVSRIITSVTWPGNESTELEIYGVERFPRGRVFIGVIA
jgi:hypothetical protein